MTEAKRWEIWVGSYADSNQVGITRLEMDEAGQLAKTGEYGGMENPSFLVLNRAGTVLYTVSETMETDGEPGGRMIAYPIEESSRKLKAGWERLTFGAAPCHIALDPGESWLAAANAEGASVTLYPLEAGGKPGGAMVRLRHAGMGQSSDAPHEPRPLSAVFDPADGRRLFVPDGGLGRVMCYTSGENGVDWSSEGSAAVSPADGPRRLLFHRDGRNAYLVNEQSSAVSRFSYDGGTGKLELQESVAALPPAYQGQNACKDAVIAPDGRFLYVSNCGHDSIAVLQIDEESGRLAASGHASARGRHPGGLAVTPDGNWLLACNRDSDSLIVFRIDPASGLPIFQGSGISIRRPSCVQIRVIP